MILVYKLCKSIKGDSYKQNIKYCYGKKNFEKNVFLEDDIFQFRYDSSHSLLEK